ncbi:MAG: type VI secretion system-associated protein TagF [Pseudomonadota bacterium]
MLPSFWTSQRIAPPAIWGRLPAHADFVRSGMRHGESDGWAHWIAAQGLSAVDADPRAEVPAAFVLPPGTLSFAPSHFVIGVIAPSGDRTGRRHPLLVYQPVPRKWLEAQLAATDSGVPSWLFWLARAVARHAARHAERGLPALTPTVHALWALHAPHPSRPWRRRADTDGISPAVRDAQSDALLCRLIGPDAPDDPAVLLPGAPRLQLPDWPHRLFRRRAESAFWQQNAAGCFTNASTRPAALWNVVAHCSAVAGSGAGAAMPSRPPATECVLAPTPSVVFALRDLAVSFDAVAQPASSEFRNDPLGSLGLPRLPPHRSANALSALLGETSTAGASTSASSLSPIAAPEGFAAGGDIGVSAADDLKYETSGQWFDALHAEFLRVVRDPMQLSGAAHWRGETASNADARTVGEAPREETGFSGLIPGVTKNAQEPIDLLIAGFGVEPVALGLVPPADILRLFAPENIQDVRIALPSLTRREHHALSPDSHMPTARRTAAPKDPS